MQNDIKNKVEQRIRELVPELQKFVATENSHGMDIDGYYEEKELHLEDVLRAMYTQKAGVLVNVDTGGYVRMEGRGFTKQSYVCHYDLSKPFSSQDESVYEFLNEILN